MPEPSKEPDKTDPSDELSPLREAKAPRHFDTVYNGQRVPNGINIVWCEDISVHEIGEATVSHSSLRLPHRVPGVSHGVTDFTWGPEPGTTLAYWLLLDVLGDEGLAKTYTESFRTTFTMGWGKRWRITGQEIREFVAKTQNPQGAA